MSPSDAAGLGKFPDNFVFGIADSDLQVISEDISRELEDSCPSMWSEFASKAGNVFQGHSPLSGSPDRYSRWREDAELISGLGVTSYRTSVSMCRILKPDLSINVRAVRWYREFFSAIKSAGVSLQVTLYHWELPQFLSERGGWTNPETIEAFLRHGEFVEQELGDLIDSYFILNEPWCSGWLGYKEGVHAPGEKSLPRALLAIHNLLLAQGLMVKRLRQVNPARILSTAYNVTSAYAATLSDADLASRRFADGQINRWFLDPLYFGSYPEDMLELYGEAVPSFKKADLDEIRVGSQLDSLGINFYSGGMFAWNDDATCHFQYTDRAGGLKNDLGWSLFVPPAYPRGLYDMLLSLYQRYSSAGLKSLFITENGAAYAPREGIPPTQDADRVYYFEKHLKQVLQAMYAGVPVHGYFAWTLIDNFEWAFGYKSESQFGMVQVEPGTLERTPKDSYYWYQRLAKSRILCDALHFD